MRRKSPEAEHSLWKRKARNSPYGIFCPHNASDLSVLCAPQKFLAEAPGESAVSRCLSRIFIYTHHGNQRIGTRESSILHNLGGFLIRHLIAHCHNAGIALIYRFTVKGRICAGFARFPLKASAGQTAAFLHLSDIFLYIRNTRFFVLRAQLHDRGAYDRSVGKRGHLLGLCGS